MNFDCTDIKAILSGLVDDEVDAATRHLAERHLSECAVCRGLMTEAEALNALIAADAEMLTAPGLPADFEDGVLSRTIYAQAYQMAGRSWTSWLGWIAAAASLGLASAIFFLDRQLPPPAVEKLAIAPDRAPASVTPSTTYVTRAKSTISEGGILADGQTSISLVSNVGAGGLDDLTRQQIAEQLALVQPTGSRRVLEQMSEATTLSRDQADALYATSNLLEQLADADLTSFADIERIREIAAYDNLLPRLADIRGHLPATERPALMAAESILLRIVEGPINLEDARILTETSRAMELSARIAAASNLPLTASSL